MATKLTTSQKSIIDNLKKEFLSMNATTEFSKGLIDIQSIMDNVSSADKYDQESKCRIQARKKVLEQQVLLDAEKLRADVEALGLVLIVKEDLHLFKVKSPNCEKGMEVKYKFTHVIEDTNPYNGMFREIPEKFGVRCDTFGYNGYVEWSYYDFNRTRTIEELIEDGSIAKCLREVYAKHYESLKTK